jgi:hypothetical protein
MPLRESTMASPLLRRRGYQHQRQSLADGEHGASICEHGASIAWLSYLPTFSQARSASCTAASLGWPLILV